MINLSIIPLPPLSSKQRPMVFSPILGLSLIQRVILAAHRSGVKLVLLLGDVTADDVKTLHSRRIRKTKNLDVSFLSIPEAEKTSITEPFLLLPADAIVPPSILQSSPEGNENREEWTGPALCQPEVFPKLLKTMKYLKKEMRFSSLLHEVYASGNVQRIPAIALAQTIPDASSRREVRKYLLNMGRKPTDGIVARNLNRPISLAITRVLLYLRIPPWPASVLNLLIGLWGGWLLGQGNYRSAAAGGFLFQLASIIDGCDGEIARINFQSSKLGGFLDIIIDITILIFFLLNLPLGAFRLTRNPLFLWIGGTMLVLVAAFYLVMIRFVRKTGLGSNIIAIAKEIETIRHGKGFMGFWRRLSSRMVILARKDVYAFLFFLVLLLPLGLVILLLGLTLLLIWELSYFLTYVHWKKSLLSSKNL